MRQQPVFILLTTISVTLFAIWPELDIETSGLFFNENGFYLGDSLVIRWIDRFGMWPMRFVTVGAFFAFVYSYNESAPDWTAKCRRSLLFLFLVGILGNGLVIETILKAHHGRARPYMVEQFGGDKVFTPFYQPSSACDTNCSFPSGHAAAGFYFVAFSYLLQGGWKREALIFGIAFGSLNALARVASGKHYLSDVVFSGLIMWLVFMVLSHFVFARRQVN